MKMFTASEIKIANEMMLIDALLNSASRIKRELYDTMLVQASRRLEACCISNNNNNRMFMNAVKAQHELSDAHIERKRKHREALMQRELMKAVA
jgi:hypothetical protein